MHLSTRTKQKSQLKPKVNQHTKSIKTSLKNRKVTPIRQISTLTRSNGTSMTNSNAFRTQLTQQPTILSQTFQISSISTKFQPRRQLLRLFSTNTNDNDVTNNNDTNNNTEQQQPIYKQQFLKATKPISPEDQAQFEKHLAKQKKLQEEQQKELDENKENGQNGANGANDDDDDDVPLTAEELFYEMPPLAQDMYDLEPREHRGTLIWLPDCFETHDQHSKSFQMMMAKQLRIVIPNPPVRECTVLGGEEQKAWYDVMSVPFKPDQCDLDYTGMKVSMYQLHQLIRDEAIRLGQKVAPFNAPADEIERLGAERVFVGGFGQGASLALFASLRYPKKLAGVVSHSGYIPFIDQTVEAGRLLEQHQRKEWELNTLEQQNINQAQKLAQQTTSEHFQQQIKLQQTNMGEKIYDISSTAPNLRAPLYILHNHTDNVIPWIELAQPSFIKAAKAPLKCKLTLRMGKSQGHSIASLDLLEMQFWANEVIGEKERNMPTADFYEREKLRELAEFGDSIIVVDKYSPHADRITMPWTAPKILESANVAQQDVKRVEELLKLIPKHPERLEEIANEIELLNREADDELWKAYLVETQQFIKQHEKYMTQRRDQEQLRLDEQNEKQQQETEQQENDNKK